MNKIAPVASFAVLHAFTLSTGAAEAGPGAGRLHPPSDRRHLPAMAAVRWPAAATPRNGGGAGAAAASCPADTALYFITTAQGQSTVACVAASK